jgi:hypothetical protein
MIASRCLSLIAGQTLRVCPEENRFPLFRIMLQCQAVHLQRGEMFRPRQTDVAPFPCSLGLPADISRRIAVPRISLKFTGFL